MRRVCLSFLLAVIAPVVAAAVDGVPLQETLTPGLQRALAVGDSPAQAADGTLAVWVHFTDKGVDGPALAAALQRTEDGLGERARKRRAKVAADKDGRLVDATDLPLHRPYTAAVAATGAVPRRESRWLNAASFDATPAQIRTLAAMPFVRRVELVRHSRRSPLPAVPAPAGGGFRAGKATTALDYGGSLAELEQINVTAVHDAGWHGQGVLIGMLDTGFSVLHEALAAVNVIDAWDFVNNDGVVDNETGDPSSARNHGTMTLSTVGGYNPGTLVGPAYGASFVLAKTEDVADELPVEEDNWVAGIEWLDTFGIDVASSSLGYYDWYVFDDLDGATAPCTIAADLAVAKGIVVVNSAGNERANAWGHIIAPADGDSVITTGAVDPDGNLTYFSSPGPTADGRTKPDVSARGQGNHVASPSDPAAYLSVSGTSFSCPLTSGVAALVLSRVPQLTPMQVREALRMTASRAGTPDNDLGWGLLDAWAAVHYFGASITHEPIGDIEDTVGPYTLTATITDREALDPAGLLLHWRVDGGPWQDVSLTSAGGDLFTADIPGQPAGSDIAYSFEAADVLGIVTLLPIDAPDTSFGFHVGPDLTPPVLSHAPLGPQPLSTWPPTAAVLATDNLGMGWVDVSWDLNGVPQPVFGLAETTPGHWSAAFPLDAGLVSVGDAVTYTVTAVDASTAANTSTSGPHIFVVIDALGVVLVVDDTAAKAGTDLKFDDAKQPLAAAASPSKTSALDMTRWLRDAGYVVHEQTWAAFTTLDLDGVQVLAVASGGNTAPVADTTQRGVIRTWIEQGGRLILEGGEMGYDALNTPGYPDFADTVMHVSAWRGDSAGDLQIASGQEFHPLATTPHAMPAVLGLNYGVYGDQDALDPDPEAVVVFETTGFSGAAGMLAYDDTPAPQAGQSVVLACNLAALADTVAARHLIENAAAWLLASEGSADGTISGVVWYLEGDIVDALSGAVVTLQTGESAVTGSDGSWSIGGLYAGNYTVTAAAAGFISEAVAVELSEGGSVIAEHMLLIALTADETWTGPLAIPDGDTAGVSAAVDVALNSHVSAVTLSINLTHPWTGDLVVELESPTGTIVRLHDRSGGSSADLVGTWDTTLDVDGPGALADFIGEAVVGTWTLRVSDRVSGDIGVLNDWTLHLVMPVPPLSVDDTPRLKTALGFASPNPFNPRTEIHFSLARPASPRLEIFDLKGRRVRTLLSGAELPPGHHAVTWLGRDDEGREAASGVYMLRLRADGVVQERKVTLAR